MKKNLKKFFVLSFLTVLLSACAATEDTISEQPVEQLYMQGYNYFKEKKLNYTCYEYRFETLDEANKFYDEKKVLDSKEVVVTITDETVFILYINPDDKGASYDSILNKAKSDKAISDIAEY